MAQAIARSGLPPQAAVKRLWDEFHRKICNEVIDRLSVGLDCRGKSKLKEMPAPLFLLVLPCRIKKAITRYRYLNQLIETAVQQAETIGDCKFIPIEKAARDVWNSIKIQEAWRQG